MEFQAARDPCGEDYCPKPGQPGKPGNPVPFQVFQVLGGGLHHMGPEQLETPKQNMENMENLLNMVTNILIY